MVEIPPGTTGCIYRLPTKKYPDPCFEVVYEGQWFAQRVNKAILKVHKGNAQVQQLMALCTALQLCQEHTKHNVREEVSAEERVLWHFWGQVYDLRFLPPDDMKQALGAFRQDNTFQQSLAELYSKKTETWARIAHEVSWGHFEYLLRILDAFLETGTLNRQCCWFLLAHHEPVMCEQGVPCPETAIDMTHRVAREQAALLVEQESKQAHPYPFLYAGSAYPILLFVRYGVE